VFYNISNKHSTFTQLSVNHPSVQVALASEFGLSLLKNGNVYFVDGTFRTTECKLILTIVLVLHDKVAVPAAYFLSNSRDTNTYKTFFDVCLFANNCTYKDNMHNSFFFVLQTLTKATKSNMRPKYCLLDFEEALAEALHKTIPDALILHDFFHFIQANVKRVGQLGMKSDASDIIADLNTLCTNLPSRI
jgi:hypothetical protein